MHYKARKQISRKRSCGLHINTLKITLPSKPAAKVVNITAYVYNNSLAAFRDFSYYNKLIVVSLHIFL